MTTTMRADSRLVFLCLCHFGMPLKVVILVLWPINAADNRAGMITICSDSASLRQRSAQRQAEIDRATSLNRQARQRLVQGRYDEAEPLVDWRRNALRVTFTDAERLAHHHHPGPEHANENCWENCY